ncbi:GAF domain-containing sensor histidine kinase [Mucilaginibacter gotjawali]|uniref:Signal transduction histidine kinase n=2 Tax=Mucilaginibacter gotjawali TaxID=1550579 RepID=A0A839S9Y5_9SPHI|nr:ATP-binding protein [Mucilaginibacter gotjawali]MBB3054063.1 signal transduction histidine kinase [Mucilaginibacter gotjawali]BAU54332.1 Phytochrome-like protein cph1 [Mucilaginibacter gotjawali]
MLNPANHKEEASRLAALNSYGILDTMPSSDLDDLAHLASVLCGTPIALISLIDEKRQWFKARVGMNPVETPREFSFCAHAILQDNDLFVVPDAREDERFAKNPLVIDDPYIVFYAGVLLKSADGYPLGTICVIDNAPKTLSNDQIYALTVLSRQVMHLLELKKSKIEITLLAEKQNLLNTRLKKSNKDLATSNAELEEFAFAASHDLQEPLRMVISFMTQIEKKYADIMDERGKKYIEFALGGAKRMRQLILYLLEFSTVGKNDHSRADVDLKVLLQKIIQQNRVKIQVARAKVLVEDLPVINIEKEPLTQVLQNLISNAIKFHPPGASPEIIISFRKTKRCWIFSVKDNGIGINSADFEKIFFIFQRLHLPDEYAGEGLGLAISKKIVNNLGGKISVRSIPGMGSEFFFTIPIQ